MKLGAIVMTTVSSAVLFGTVLGPAPAAAERTKRRQDRQARVLARRASRFVSVTRGPLTRIVQHEVRLGNEVERFERFDLDHLRTVPFDPVQLRALTAYRVAHPDRYKALMPDHRSVWGRSLWHLTHGSRYEQRDDVTPEDDARVLMALSSHNVDALGRPPEDALQRDLPVLYDRDTLSAERKPQMMVSRTLGVDPPVTGKHYASVIGLRQVRRLFSLKKGQVFLDLGAGEGRAIGDFLERGGRADVIAVDFAILPALRDLAQTIRREKGAGRLRVVESDFADLGKRGLPPVDYATDVMATAYSPEYDRTLRAVVGVLKVGGALATHVGNQTVIIDPQGRRIDVIDYFKAIRGVDVKVVGGEAGEARQVVLTRTGKQVRVPKLELLAYSDAGPPKRIFLWRGARVEHRALQRGQRGSPRRAPRSGV